MQRTNRSFLAAAVLAAACLAAVPPTLGTPPAEAAEPTRPNVLVVNLDDARFDALAHMPKTRGWLSTARQFPKAFVAIPSCCPSRSSLMTGRYAHNGIRLQKDAAKLDRAGTIQRYLKGAGYKTGMTGKFLVSWPLATAPPDFDRYMTILGGYYSYDANLNGAVSSYSTYSTTTLGARLRRFVTLFEQEGDATPWYLYFAPQAPHISAGWLSYAVPETKYADAPVGDCVQQGEPDRTDKPAYMSWVNLSRDHYLKLCQSQIRALLSVDDELDLTMRHLQSTGELDNTLVVFTSDNGYLWNDHNRQSKFVPYEASIRVPLWLRWPGRIAAGSDARLASNIDVLPTILAAANVTPKTTLAPIDGRSLTGTDQRIEVLSEYWYDPDSLNVPSWAALRSGTRKYVETYETDSAGNVKVFRELYDLTKDPGELTNILRDGTSANDPTASELSRWSTRLAAARSCSGTACP